MTGDYDAEQKLVAIEAEVARMYRQINARLSAIADELRRAEARDEWAAAQLREARRDIRRCEQALAKRGGAAPGEDE